MIIWRFSGPTAPDEDTCDVESLCKFRIKVKTIFRATSIQQKTEKSPVIMKFVVKEFWRGRGVGESGHFGKIP